ncbi:MAG: hypothetical protein WBO77_02725, partial [Microgenomates group bacterium]
PELLKTMLMLHDVGNIVKFDFDKYPEFLGDEIKRVDYWKDKQQETITKYGADDHDATVAMLEELRISSQISQRIYDMGYWNVKVISERNDWMLKVALYSDLRVGPMGILSMTDRVNDIHDRLAKYKNKPELIGYSQELEKQIQENMDAPVDRITDEDIETDRSLLQLELMP